MSLIVKPTTLIHYDDDYLYIGVTVAKGVVPPPTDQPIWEITRVTYDDGKAVKIENGISGKNRTFLIWDKKETYNYI